MAIQLSISPQGRVRLPAAIRAHLGVKCGGTLFVEEVENGVLLRSVAQVIGQAQALKDYRRMPVGSGREAEACLCGAVWRSK